jgi:hypothetical protein
MALQQQRKVQQEMLQAVKHSRSLYSIGYLCFFKFRIIVLTKTAVKP